MSNRKMITTTTRQFSVQEGLSSSNFWQCVWAEVTGLSTSLGIERGAESIHFHVLFDELVFYRDALNEITEAVEKQIMSNTAEIADRIEQNGKNSSGNHN